MPRIKPFLGYYVRQEDAVDVVSPAYDTLTPAQRYEYAERHPRNYFNVIRSLEEFPEHKRPTEDELLASNAKKLKELLEGGAYIYTSKPCFFIYRLQIDGHVQTGLIADVPLEEYDADQIKKHENTRQDKEDQLVRHQEIVGATSSPICLAYKDQPKISQCMDQLTSREPIIDLVLEDGVAQTVWSVDDEAIQKQLISLFAKVPITYVTDGHHRCAAISRYAERMRTANPEQTEEAPYNYLFVGLFPDTELRIVAYNRCVKGLNNLSAEDFIIKLQQSFVVEALTVRHANEAEPRRPREMAMYLEKQWYRLTAKSHIVIENDPVRTLDVMILHDHILEAILGIEDPRTDPRIEYVAGTFGLSELQDRCVKEGEGTAFAIYPTSIDQLMAVADVGEVMPPKSTCFDPKVRSGLFVRPL